MSNSNFDKNGVDSSGVHWFQYVAFVATALAIYLDGLFNNSNFYHFALKIFKFWNCNVYNPLSYCIMHWKINFYP